MKEIRNKLKSFFNWLFRWLKYIIIIIIGFIYSLFKKEEIPKIEKRKQELRRANKKTYQVMPEVLPETPKSFIKNSIFSPTKEELKEEILKFYCEEKNIKKYELEKTDEKVLEYLEEKLIPTLEEETQKKQINTKELLKEQIKKLGTEELLNLENQKKSFITSEEILNHTQKQPTDFFFRSKPKETKEEQKIEANTVQKEEPLIERMPINTSLNSFKEELAKNTTPSNPNVYITKPEVLNQEINVNETSIPLIIPPKPEEKSIEQMKADTDLIVDFPPNEIPSVNEINIIEEKKEKEESKTLTEKPKQQVPEEKTDELEKIKKEPEFIAINLYLVETEIKKLELVQENEVKKTDFEDKNYDELLSKIEHLLNEIEKIQKKNLKPEDRKKLLEKELQLKNLKDNLENNKAKDLEIEKNLLEENITEMEITGLLENLKKLHLEHQIDLANYSLNKAEDLENLSKEKLKIVEKELIKAKIKKASKSLELSSLILLPFIRNRYFFMFTAGIFVNNHFKLLDYLLKHKSVTYTPLELEHLKKGSDALEEALNLTNTNLSYLSHLEQNILSKYPELSVDEEYLLYLNKLRYSLLKNEEKLLKKKKTIEKYNLKYQIKIRKLKKKKKVA